MLTEIPANLRSNLITLGADPEVIEVLCHEPACEFIELTLDSVSVTKMLLLTWEPTPGLKGPSPFEGNLSYRLNRKIMANGPFQT